jgi:hypothetical protein
MKLSLALLACALSAMLTLPALSAPAPISAGHWSADLGDTGPARIAYKGESIAVSGSLAGYLPNWKGARFAMDGAQVAADATSATWQKAVPGNQEATLKLELTPQKARFSLATTLIAAGPSEFAIQVQPEAVRTAPDHAWVWVNGDLHDIALGDPFPQLQGIEEARFERPDRTVIVRCSGFAMQDRRADGSGLFFVQVLSADGSAPRKTQSFIEFEVIEAPAADIPARTALLSQRVEALEAVPMVNAGFESDKPLEGWSENPNAVRDTETRHSGNASARVTIKPEGGVQQNVYLVQNVPVREGHAYRAEAWIKTQGIEAATLNGMSPTGATVIIEFADKQGKWLAAGSYAAGVYGNSDWRRIRTEPARAPEGAGFAVIFLSMRCTGTGWFDDVSLTEVRDDPVLFGPLPGAAVASNVPSFQWYYAWKTTCALDLSRDESFPAGNTMSLSGLEESTAQVEKPLAPGKWFWRVRVPEHHVVSQTWAFTQTVPLDRDCTPPKIVENHGCLRSRTETVRVQYSDNVGVAKVVLTVDGRDVSSLAKIGKTEATYVPKEGWSEGLHKIVVQAADAAGNQSSRTLFYTCCKPMPRTVWKQYGGVETDGKMRFLFGMYGCRIEDMPRIAAGGFDFVHSYQWDGDGTNEEALQYLDAARKNGLQAFIGLCRPRLMRGDEEFVAERVGALMSHPGLFAWYLYDEPDSDFQYVSPQWLARYRRLINALDPYHPVVVTCAGDPAVPLYKDAFDVHWTQVYGSTEGVASRMDLHRKGLRPGTPLSAILHCYDAAQSSLEELGKTPDPAKFQPDAAVMRANAFMALVHNTSCIEYWWWGQGTSGSCGYTVAKVPWAWAALQKTIADIKQLRPVLTAPGPIDTWVQKTPEGTEVHLWEKRFADRTVIIAVNRDGKPCSLVTAPKALPAHFTANVLFEARSVSVNDGQLRDTFDPLGVHVYEVREGR